MRMVVIYRPNSEYGRITEDFIKEFNDRHPLDKVEVINVDTRNGIAMATLYDVVQYPGILILRNDGSVSMTWQGPELPLMDEVAAYANV
jgi:hypothetical protein